MRKKIMVGVLTAALSSLGLMAAPAPAAADTCQTNPDVGDICKVVDTLCNNKVWQKVSDNC